MIIRSIRKAPVDADAAEGINNLTVPEILESFRTFDGTYKREEIDAAIRLKEEMIPNLIAVLENLLADPQQYVEDFNLFDHIYAVMLLGYFKEPGSHQVIIDIFSLPDDVPDQLFGDICTADLPMILLNTCNGCLEKIKSLILNKKANDYCRISACQALVYAVLEEMVPREAVIEFFNSLFTGDEASEESDFWGLLSLLILDLYPEESMAVIEKAYEDELIFPDMAEFSDFQKALSFGKDKCLEKLKRDFEQDSLDDIHSRISWWDCFNRGDRQVSSPPLADDIFSGISKQDMPREDKKVQKAKKKHKKKKRKQARASKKKNRR